MRASFSALLLLSLGACVAPAPRARLAAPAPVFSPNAFFSGQTRGDGELRVILSGTKPVRVVGQGRVERDGTLILDQEIREGDKRPRTRQWRIREDAPGQYVGTLTDAKGPIRGEVSGNLLHLRYTSTDNLAIEQWIYLQSGGQVALNRMRVSRFGVPVAALSETIRRVP